MSVTQSSEDSSPGAASTSGLRTNIDIREPSIRVLTEWDDGYECQGASMNPRSIRMNRLVRNVHRGTEVKEHPERAQTCLVQLVVPKVKLLHSQVRSSHSHERTIALRRE